MNNSQLIKLAQQLIRMDTMNPPGNEQICAEFLGGMLEGAGYEAAFHDFAPGRTNLVAYLPGAGGKPICLSGHLDTVPLGEAAWSFDPLGGEIHGDRLVGRGSSDMKGGVAAIVAAALDLARMPRGRGGVLVVLTAGEETGCLGAAYLAGEPGILPQAGALVVAEPTSNYPMLGHKGAFWITGVAKGKSAHGSMPHLGDNAIEKAARAIVGLKDFNFGLEPHPHMGPPTFNLGTISGGIKPNMVPDRAQFTLDLRLIPGQSPEQVQERLAGHMGPEIELEPGVAAPAVWTDPADPWAGEVCGIMAGILGTQIQPQGLSYFTDAAALAGAMDAPPSLILGPGEAGQAHQTDEFCYTEKIIQAAEAYREIGRRWLKA